LLTYYRTSKIKELADIRPLAIDDTDSIIRSFHLELARPEDSVNGHAEATNGHAEATNGHAEAVNGHAITAE
jgi:hypothetical protein